jgi:hypothetical protein
MSFEDLAGRVPGVLALRTVKDDEVITEVHVLVAPGAPSGDIARSIRSVALLSDIDLPLERLHIVQLEPDHDLAATSTAEPAVTDDADAPDDPVGSEAVASVDIDLVAPTPAAAPLRPRLVSVEVRVVDGVGRAVVEVGHGIRADRGVAEFVPTTPTERRAVAEATLRALTAAIGWRRPLAVDTAVVVSMPNLDIALVTLAIVAGEERTLVGAAPVHDGGVHDALARATLDATNRAVARHGSELGR